MTIERRMRRSSNRADAFHLYLTSLAERSCATWLVVADGDGLLVDGIGTKEQLEEMAAVGAAVEAEEPVHTMLLPTSRALLRLTSIGGQRPSPDEATAAFDRIMTWR
jgi:hypothetical protein